MEDRLIERLCFLLAGLTLSWLVFVVCDQMEVQTLYVGLVVVLPVAATLAVLLLVKLLQQYRRDQRNARAMQELSVEWDRIEAEDSD